MNQAGDDRYRSVDDALAAYEGLPDIDRRNLVNAARALAGSWKYVSPNELISEAYIRMAEGRRRWSSSEAFTTFFAGVMKSLVTDRMFLTDEGKVVRLKNKMSVIHPDDLPLVAANDDIEDLRNKVLVEEFASALEARIEGDEELQLLWAGIQRCLKGKELQEELGVDEKQLATLRTRLNRHLDKLCVEYQAKEGRS